MEQLLMVDEAQFLTDIAGMVTEITPLEVNKYRNKFVGLNWQ